MFEGGVLETSRGSVGDVAKCETEVPGELEWRVTKQLRKCGSCAITSFDGEKNPWIVHYISFPNSEFPSLGTK